MRVASMGIEVSIESGASQRRMVVDGGAPITIGRDPECVLRLESRNVSRKHAVLQVQGDMLTIRDVSSNGTLVGTQPLRGGSIRTALATPLTIGEFKLTLARARSGRLPTEERRDRRVPSSLAPDAPVSKAAATPEKGQSEQDSGDGGPSVPAALRREAHRRLLQNLDLRAVGNSSREEASSLRPQVLAALRKVLEELAAEIPQGIDQNQLVGELADEALGLGPLERFLGDPKVSEIMVVDPDTIYVERGGKLTKSSARFTDDDRVRAVIERIVAPLGRRIDESSPLVDARLKDGSRVNAVIPPLALRGSCITIRKFARVPLTADDLVKFGALTESMARFLARSVIAKKNIVVSGGTGSGKTTLLNVLSGSIPASERVVTIEDAAELQLKQPHVVSLESRPANMEGKGEYTIRDLVKNALRMRPDRIVVGECRGGEALDMLQAMNTGHDGSLTTTHANSPTEAITRLETLVLMGGVDLPVRAIREQIVGAVHVIVQQSRLSDGSRKITNISEVAGFDDSGRIQLTPIFEFRRTGVSETGAVLGEFRATGFLPSYLGQMVVMGLIKPGEPYL